MTCVYVAIFQIQMKSPLTRLYDLCFEVFKTLKDKFLEHHSS